MNWIGHAAFAAAILFASVDAFGVNKCIDASGRTTYQDRPCPIGTDQQQAQVRDQPQPSPKESSGPGDEPTVGPVADDASEDTAILALVSMQTGFELCAKSSDDFQQKHGDVFAAWRDSHAREFERLSRSPRFQQILANGRRQVEAQAPMMVGMGPQFAQFCAGQFILQMQANTANGR